ncbi:hypothetical protein SAY87_008400 [Trapa incisa]|uniref:K-box domain-containing protein n=1 Tax=Trapa incisa TaxID=236973 RepID=A0AAN7QGQ0_9MYRT|nr:hypothetical protein SAY87_008400 [Trapa incisa]
MDHTLERYKKGAEAQVERSSNVCVMEQEPRHQMELKSLKSEITRLRIEHARSMGRELDGLSFKELQKIECQLTEGLMSVKQKKERFLLGEISRSRSKEQKAMLENETLRREMEKLRGSSSTRNPLLEFHRVSPITVKPCHSDGDDAANDNHTPDVSLQLISLATGGDGRKRKAPETECTAMDDSVGSA